MEENATALMKKKASGRRKIQIKKIENKKNLLVSFSRRRAGLFKKAAEYSKISGAHVAILVQSPGGKFYSFGGPASVSVDSILDQYLAGIMPSSLSSSYSNNDATSVDDGARNKCLETMEKFIEEEVKDGGVMETNQGSDGKQYLLDQPLEDNLEWVDELENYMIAMEGLESKDLFQEDDAMNRSADHTINLEYFDDLPMNNNLFQEDDEITRVADTINLDVDSSSYLIPNANLDYFGGLPVNNHFFQDDEITRAAENINGIAGSSSSMIPNANVDFFGGFPVNNDFFQHEEITRAADSIDGIADSSSLLMPNVNLDCSGGLPLR